MIVFMHPVISVLVEVSIMALQFSRLSYTTLPLSTVIEVRPLQSMNVLPLIKVTELGIVTDVRPVHL